MSNAKHSSVLSLFGVQCGGVYTVQLPPFIKVLTGSVQFVSFIYTVITKDYDETEERE